MKLHPAHRSGLFAIASLLVISAASPGRADDEAAPKADSPLVRLLKSGKVPPERQPAIVDQLGKRGSADDLAFLLDKALQADGLTPAARVRAFDSLAEAAVSNKVIPSKGRERLAELLAPTAQVEPALRLAALRLTALWKVEALASTVAKLAEADTTAEDLRASAFDALVALNKTDVIEPLTDPKRALNVRLLAVAALARLGVDSAAEKAVALLADLKAGPSPTPLIAAFLDRQGGSDKLAAQVAKAKPTADAAKLALRSVYELGRTDPALVTELTKAAGLSNEVKPPTPAEVEALIAEVQSKGNAERGEAVFRRSDVNCAKCHALSGAGGGVGPELSPIGLTSPVDYLINSILVPDLSIKEEFQTKVFLTNDGRVFQGIVADKDEKRVILREATGDLRTIPTGEIEESKDGGSLMPKGLTNFMTRTELVDVLRFLSELGKPGPYAIRPIPSLQRWRVLKAPSAELTTADPDETGFQKEVLGADPKRWQPAYAKVGGDLPLAELVALSGSKTLYLQAEVEVSAEGPLTFLLDTAAGVTAWIDGKRIGGDHRENDGANLTRMLTPGRRTLTLRVDTSKRTRPTIRVDAVKPAVTSIEFRVIGGR